MTHSRNGGKTAEDLPPSCRCVLLAFDIHDAERLLWQDLKDETDLPDRTLSRALSTLESHNKIHLTRKNDDLRQIVATLAETHSYNHPESDTSR